MRYNLPNAPTQTINYCPIPSVTIFSVPCFYRPLQSIIYEIINGTLERSKESWVIIKCAQNRDLYESSLSPDCSVYGCVMIPYKKFFYLRKRF